MRRFTLEEASAALGEVEPLLTSLRDAHATMEELHDDVTASAPTNGGGEVHRRFGEAAALSASVLERLEQIGVLVRDPATGLIDFPSERDGVEVYLCWRLGEDAIAWWHPPDTGFAGRRPL